MFLLNRGRGNDRDSESLPRVIFTRDSIAGSAYMLRQFRPSVRLSVRHTGGSVKNG